MVALARTLYRGPAGAKLSDAERVQAVLGDIAKEHTTPEKLLEAAKAAVARERAFVDQHHLLSLPAQENLQVVWTPAFMRSQYGVAGYDGPPPLTPDVGAFFYVTPFPKEWSADRIESQLREYNRFKMELLWIHEAMPGHFRAARLGQSRRTANAACFALAALIDRLCRGVGGVRRGSDARPELRARPRMRMTYLKEWLRIVGNTLLDIGIHMRR